jgi:hypothetical protein
MRRGKPKRKLKHVNTEYVYQMEVCSVSIPLQFCTMRAGQSRAKQERRSALASFTSTRSI